jgi:hypothetical protein
LPLHHAAANGAPLEVMKLLLDANPEAVNAADEVRRAEPTRRRWRCEACIPSLVSALITAARPLFLPGTALRRTKGCRCTTLQRRARH